MTIANRSIMFQQEEAGWVNPYVTDGLIAMWDGEWNAGGGVHDPNATTWKDLIAGNDMSFVGTIEFGDQYCYFTTSTSYSNAPLTNDMLSDLANGYTDQCVIVHQPIYSSGSANGIFAISRCGLVVRGTNLAILQPITPSGAGSYIYHSLSAGVYSVVADTSASLIYEDDDVISTQTGYVITQSSTANGFTCNHRENYAQYGLGNLHIGCRRVYSRALTAAEIAANYAVDKARFNLP